MKNKLALRLLIYALLYTTFALGLPQFHYATAIMIALIIRHKDDSRGLLAPIGEHEPELSQSRFSRRWNDLFQEQRP